MTRHNFSKATRKAAYARSGGRCEASGPRYQLAAGERCNADLAVTGMEVDHYPLGAHAEGSNRLENAVACCPHCNQVAANTIDKQVEQKIKNLSYDAALHEARMARKAGLDVPDPPKPRGRQAQKKAMPQSRGFDKTRKRKMDGTVVPR